MSDSQEPGDAEYGLVRPFLIDNGELEGCTRAEAFVLGYELALIDHLIDNEKAWQTTVHSANQARIEHQLNAAGREYRWEWPATDRSEAWVHLIVSASEGR